MTMIMTKNSQWLTVCFIVTEKLSGVRLSTSHAAQVNSPVTLELVSILKRNQRLESTPSTKTSDVHYLWVFGDEASCDLTLCDFFY